MTFTAISTFSGAGGMDVGFKKAGFKIVWANDIKEDACATYAANHGNHIKCGDLSEYVDSLTAFRGTDVVFGGPPCQGFSVAGKMDPNDERSKLVFKFMDVVERVKPSIFVMENVKALGVLEKWKPIRDLLIHKAESLGYSAQIILVNAVDYGVPQKRERMFLIGIRDQKNRLPLDLLLKRYQAEAPTLIDLFKKLGPAGSKDNSRVCNAKISFAQNPVLRKSPYAGMLFNGAGRPINPMGYSCTLAASMGGNKTPIVDDQQIFSNKPSWIENYHSILMKGGNAFKEGQMPSFLRRITVDEAARIQTFPDDYIFAGKKNSIYCQIGNAVPCNLAFAVGKLVFDMLSVIKREQSMDYPHAIEQKTLSLLETY